MNHSKPTTKA